MTAPPPDRDKLIDWAAARARLARAAEATRTAAKPSRAQAAQILAERALALAEPRRGVRSPSRMLEIVTFAIDGERFGLETRYVRAVGREPSITPIPWSADFVLGVTSFRGGITAVFDIRPLFNGLPRGPTAPSCILFLGRDEIDFAIVADTVDEVIRTPADDVGHRPWRLDGATSEAASGLRADALNILDGAALLNDERLFIDQARAGPANVGVDS
jgi:purine-binding chemotaxis protein CheW